MAGRVSVKLRKVHQPEEVFARMSSDERELWSAGFGRMNLDSGSYERG